MIRITHFIPIFQKVSGVSTFVGEIANAQVAAGNDVAVATLPQYTRNHYPILDAVRVVDMAEGLEWRGTPPDIVHIHGIWTPVLHRIVSHAVEVGTPIAWSPHGMLAPWAMRHKGWKKWPVWWLWQKRDLAKADTIHATSDLEADWIRGLGLRNKLSVVPLGTPLPEKTVCLQTEEKMVLFVGRIYPVKGLVNLIKAWSLLSEEAERGLGFHDSRSWKLRIVGPDEAGHKFELEKLIDAKGLRGRVEFAGAKYGKLLDEEYDKCECLVLPSFTENFGATVLEALAHGKSCIASTYTPWKELEEKGCGWWVSNEPDTLAKTIQEMISIGGAKRREMGDKGRKLVEEKYSWNSVAAKMLKEYASLL